MSQNKRTVQEYMDAFTVTDHPRILVCLTDDVEWIIPGAFHIRGKAAFDREIEGEAFVGSPAISMTRLTEENDVVVAEGTVRTTRRVGTDLRLAFCDVFEMEAGRIKRLTSYVVELRG